MFIYTVATCKFHKLLQIFFLLLLKQQSFFILQANSTRTFLHVLFYNARLSRFLYKKKKVNKRTKIYNYVKRENVAIATHLPPKWYGCNKAKPLKEEKNKNKRLQ